MLLLLRFRDARDVHSIVSRILMLVKQRGKFNEKMSAHSQFENEMKNEYDNFKIDEVTIKVYI